MYFEAEWNVLKAKEELDLFFLRKLLATLLITDCRGTKVEVWGPEAKERQEYLGLEIVRRGQIWGIF